MFSSDVAKENHGKGSTFHWVELSEGENLTAKLLPKSGTGV